MTAWEDVPNEAGWEDAPAAPVRSGGVRAARMGGQFAQNFNDAIANMAGAPVDLVAAGLQKIGVPVNDPFGGSASLKRGIDAIASVPGRIGLTTEDAPVRFDPETRGEKIAAGVGEGVGMVASTLAPAGAIARALPTGTASQGVAKAVASQPRTQVAAGTAAGATTGATDNPWLGLAAALAVPAGVAGTAAAGRGARSLAMPDTERSVQSILARALQRDNTTGIALGEAQAARGPGALAVEAGGPNVRGALRGSIAAPGAARTTVQDAFDARIAGSNARTTQALDTAAGSNSSLATTVDDLATARATAARPAYEAAGIPRRPEAKIWAIDQPPAWNTRTVQSKALDDLHDNSSLVRGAMSSLRQFTDYKDVPRNTMSMWDAAYKRLGGMEQAAVRSGDNRLAMLIGDERRKLLSALTDENPDYFRALKEYSGPSKLIESAERGREWFAKNADPAIVAREFGEMVGPEKDAAVIGIRDWARNAIGRSDRGGAAERVWAGGNNRERLEAILGPDAFKKLQSVMETEKGVFKTARDINVGSRTTPMAKESADNAIEAMGPIADLLRGRVGSALGKVAGRGYDRVVEGRTEAVNKRIAELLTSSDADATKAFFRTGAIPKGTPSRLAPMLGAETLRRAIDQDPGNANAAALARALMRENEQRRGAGR